MAEVREPSPDDDVIPEPVLDAPWINAERAIIRECLAAANARPRDVPDFMAGAACAILAARRSFVPQARLAAVEAELAEARATIERVETLCVEADTGYEDGPAMLWARQVRAALAGPPAPKETP